MDIAPGAIINEYRLEARLGGGAFGSVWRAEHVETGDVVAIKLLTGVLASDARGDIRREIEVLAAMASTRSPHVVRVLGGGAEPVPHIIMEFIDGSDLAARLRDNHHLPVEETIEIGLAIAGALAVLKDGGIIHRDVKPANVLIGRDGTARLADFGIAKIIGFETITMTGQLPMTMAYAAPEVWDGRATHLSDLYAMGVLLYQCLAGEPPFSGSYSSLFKQHTTVAPDLARLPEEMPTHLRALIAACLQKQPGARPADATACIAMLEDARHELADPSSVEPAAEVAGLGVASVGDDASAVAGAEDTTLIAAPILRDETAVGEAPSAAVAAHGDGRREPPTRPPARGGAAGKPFGWRIAGIGAASLAAAAIAATAAFLLLGDRTDARPSQTPPRTATARGIETSSTRTTATAATTTKTPTSGGADATSTAWATATPHIDPTTAAWTATVTPTMVWWPTLTPTPTDTPTRIQTTTPPTPPSPDPPAATFTPTSTPTATPTPDFTVNAVVGLSGLVCCNQAPPWHAHFDTAYDGPLAYVLVHADFDAGNELDAGECFSVNVEDGSGVGKCVSDGSPSLSSIDEYVSCTFDPTWCERFRSANELFGTLQIWVDSGAASPPTSLEVRVVAVSFERLPN